MRSSNHFGFFTGQEQACCRPAFCIVNTGSFYFEQVLNEQKGDITKDIAGGKFTFVQVIDTVSFFIDAVIYEPEK